MAQTLLPVDYVNGGERDYATVTLDEDCHKTRPVVPNKYINQANEILFSTSFHCKLFVL